MEAEGWEGPGQEGSEGLCSGGMSTAGRLTGPFPGPDESKAQPSHKRLCDRTIWKKNHLEEEPSGKLTAVFSN